MCDICNNTGHIVVEVPVFADGGYSDVDQVTAPCRCNPDPTDFDYPEFDVVEVDFDRRIPDGTLPAALLA